MKIEPMPIKIRDLIKGYTENPSTGEVIALNGTLDVRPKYQREYVYEQKESEAVIDTVIKGFPLNSMYWCVRPDGTYEVMDGQQRTISICRFATNPAYSVKLRPRRRGQRRQLPQPLRGRKGTLSPLRADGIRLRRNGIREDVMVPDHQHRGERAIQARD